MFEKCGFAVEGTLCNFEPAPTEEQRRNGLQLAPRSIIGALVPEDVPGLPWYADVARADDQGTSSAVSVNGVTERGWGRTLPS
ncbi:hypothetical protein [Myxococcus sp. AB036A]|uniref:hypothetical protein n=1 Tax=Myxococcus sp. AB036A TaxID=2562793 RepID=UPI00114693AD|nr:hypothetical protein [Myxococcus sp. AB036A]